MQKRLIVLLLMLSVVCMFSLANAQALVTFEVPCFFGQWGSGGSENGQFNLPHSVTVDGAGKVYVADTHNNRIQVFNSTGTYIRQWGSAGTAEGQFSVPIGVAVDEGGHVYVADALNNRVQVFDSLGTYLRQWGTLGSGDGQFLYAWGIALDIKGNVYVGDYLNHRIQVFTSSGQYLRQWGIFGIDSGQFNYPYGIGVDGNGHVYVADSHNDRVQVFDSVGTFLRQWGTSGSASGEFHHPDGVAVDRFGCVYVTDSENYRVQVFDTSGAFLYQLGTQTPGSGEGEFNLAYGVAVDRSGQCVYVADSYNNRIQLFVCHLCPVATQLQAFDATYNRSRLGIEVTWTVSELSVNAEFTISRAEAVTGVFSEMKDPKIENNRLSFTYFDKNTEPGKRYSYKVEVADEAGRRVLFSTNAISAPTLPLSLAQNSPNPFNPSTTISYLLPKNCEVRLEVFDVAGRRIAVLVDAKQDAGGHAVSWNGKNFNGSVAGSGIYFYRLTAGKESVTRKMILLR
jgi:DNA-binding beta-propeller fold protein YncE